jgi:hypothetical protein
LVARLAQVATWLWIVQNHTTTHKEKNVKYQTDKFYALFGNKVVGPYGSYEEAWHDTGGDVAWILLGNQIPQEEVAQ